MNSTALIYGSLIHLVICIAVAAAVFLKDPSKAIHRNFSLWAILTGVLGSHFFISGIAKTDEAALLTFRAAMVGAVFMPAAYIHFLNLHLKKDFKSHGLSIMFYVISLIFALTCMSKWMIASVTSSPGMPHMLTQGIAYHAFMVYLIMTMLFGLVLLLNRMRKEPVKPIRKKLLMHFWFAILSSLGIASFVLAFYGYKSLAPTSIMITIYVIAMGYATVNYRLWHSDFIIGRVMTYISLAVIFAAIYFGGVFFLDSLMGTRSWLHDGIAAFGAFLIGYYAHRPFQDLFSASMIFRKKYDYQKLLKDASRGMSKIESLDHLLRLVIHFITMKMQVHNAAVLTKQSDGKYKIDNSRGYQGDISEYTLDSENPLIQYLAQEKEAIDLENIQDFIAAGGTKKTKGVEARHYDFEAMRETMREMHAVCCVPSFLSRDLKNILILGEKKSGDFFTEADLTILFTLAQESAIAIENAGLYDEAVKKTTELANINEQLEYSKSLLMKALNETEVANKQLQDTQAQLIHEQKMATLGRLAASVGHEVNNPLTILSMNVSRAILKYRKNPDLRVGDILELFQKMEQNIGRIKAVVNTLTGLLKKSEKGKFEPLSLKLILEETLPLVQFQTYLDNLTGTEVEFDIPGNIPLVRGDLERLQEVFLNLFINAYHAMAGKRNRRIQVKAEVSEDDAKLVSVRFNDNGSGMSEETMKKIFSYGFTTKAPGKGSGLGLYMCKYIIELHGGDMRVESEIGVGTTFVLSLPIYEEESTSPGDLKIGGASR